MHQNLRWVSVAAAWIVILVATAAVILAVLVPRIVGATPYTVLTGSMRPELPPGTLVVVKPVEATQIRVGEVITYQPKSGKATVITHRVTSVKHTLDGEVRFTTQGDANNTADAVAVQPVQVKGKVWYSVPYLGYVNNALSGSQRQIATYGVAGALILYAGWMFTSSWRDRRRELNTATANGVNRQSAATDSVT